MNLRALLLTGLCVSAVALSGFCQEGNATANPYAVFKSDVGSWDAEMTMWMGADGKADPTAQPMKATGEEHNHMMGEYWLVSDFKADMGGMPFEGHSVTGYNSADKKYEGSWVDTMNPNVAHMTGTYDPKTRTMTSFSTVHSATGTVNKSKMEVVYDGDKKRVMTMYDLKEGTDGEWIKSMQIVYTRKAEKSSLNFKMKTIDGDDANLSDYAGKVVMVVNVASYCGMTKQYSDLQALYEKYGDQGFVVLGFPCNQFGEQEPGSEADIKTFCSTKYNVTFPMFAKIEVKGDGQADLYKYLTSQDLQPKGEGEIGWNFEKFIVGRDGQPIARFASRVSPSDPDVIRTIESALKN